MSHGHKTILQKPCPDKSHHKTHIQKSKSNAKNLTKLTSNRGKVGGFGTYSLPLPCWGKTMDPTTPKKKQGNHHGKVCPAGGFQPI